jgi:hypothetical protein
VDAEALDADADLRRGERLVVDAPDLGAVERVREVAPNSSMSKWSTPRPTSSST